MATIDQMAQVIAAHEGRGITSSELLEQLYQRMVQMGKDAPTRLEGRYAAALRDGAEPPLDAKRVA